jgi:dihydroxy-acid dehydratase
VEFVWFCGDEANVGVDAEKNRIDMDVSVEEIDERLKEWKAPSMLVTRGVLAKYARLVGDASHGAMTDLF